MNNDFNHNSIVLSKRDIFVLERGLKEISEAGGAVAALTQVIDIVGSINTFGSCERHKEDHEQLTSDRVVYGINTAIRFLGHEIAVQQERLQEILEEAKDRS